MNKPTHILIPIEKINEEWRKSVDYSFDFKQAYAGLIFTSPRVCLDENNIIEYYKPDTE